MCLDFSRQVFINKKHMCNHYTWWFKMPKHIASGLKYLAAVKLKDAGESHQAIAEELGVDRSTISHYLNGRNLSWNSIEVARTITGCVRPCDWWRACTRDRKPCTRWLKALSASSSIFSSMEWPPPSASIEEEMLDAQKSSAFPPRPLILRADIESQIRRYIEDSASAEIGRASCRERV